jgi:hypothetical protein
VKRKPYCTYYCTGSEPSIDTLGGINHKSDRFLIEPLYNKLYCSLIANYCTISEPSFDTLGGINHESDRFLIDPLYCSLIANMLYLLNQIILLDPERANALEVRAAESQNIEIHILSVT